MAVEGINQGNEPLGEEERARIAQIEKERVFSDAELLKGGAEYVVDESGEKVLSITRDQRIEINSDLPVEREKERRQKIVKMLQEITGQKGPNVFENGPVKVKIKFRKDNSVGSELTSGPGMEVNPELMFGDSEVIVDVHRFSFNSMTVVYPDSWVPAGSLSNTGPVTLDWVESVEKA